MHQSMYQSVNLSCTLLVAGYAGCKVLPNMTVTSERRTLKSPGIAYYGYIWVAKEGVVHIPKAA